MYMERMNSNVIPIDNYSKAKVMAENLNVVYFEMKCNKERLPYFKLYLGEKGFQRDNMSENKVLGQHIIQWKDTAGRFKIANLKHNPHNDYPVLIQFENTQKPLAKGEICRDILEQLLNICQQNTLRCGYIHQFKGNVFCHYDGDFAAQIVPIKKTYNNNLVSKIKKQVYKPNTNIYAQKL